MKNLATDSEFLANLRAGHQWEEALATVLRHEGFDAAAHPLRVRPSKAKRRSYADGGDIIIRRRGRPPVHLDVKSRELSFGWGPSSYPHDPVFVMNARPWARRRKKPVAVALVSRLTGCIVVVPVSTAPQWDIKRVENHAQGVQQAMLTCPRHLLRAWPEFVSWLRADPPGP